MHEGEVAAAFRLLSPAIGMNQGRFSPNHLDVAKYFNPVVLSQPAQSRDHANGVKDIQVLVTRAYVAGLQPDSAHAADLKAAANNPMFPQAPGTCGVILRHGNHSSMGD
jgi:hypothetical protein